MVGSGGWVGYKCIMISLLQRVRQSAFLRYNAVSFAGAMGIAFLNYLYYPVLGRLMNPADFGEVQTIISLFLQTVVFLGVFGLVTVGVVTKYEDHDIQNRLIAELEKLALMLAVVLLAILLLFGRQFADFLQFADAWPFLALVAALLLSVPGAFRNAFMQGRRQFAALSRAGILAASAKLVFAVIFVLLGGRAFGALFGLVMAQLIALAYTTSVVRRLGWRRPADFKRFSLPDLALLKPELRYGLLVLVTTLSMNLLLTLDIIVVKHLFDPTEAGLYAGIATIARIIYFATGPMAIVLLPSVRLAQPADQNSRLLLQSLGLFGVVGGGALAVFTLAPELVIRVMIGAKYLPYAYLLPRLGLAIFLVSLANLLSYYYLALRRPFIGAIGVASVLTTGALLMLNHSTLINVVNGLIGGSCLAIVLITATYLLYYRNPSWRRHD